MSGTRSTYKGEEEGIRVNVRKCEIKIQTIIQKGKVKAHV